MRVGSHPTLCYILLEWGPDKQYFLFFSCEVETNCCQQISFEQRREFFRKLLPFDHLSRIENHFKEADNLDLKDKFSRDEDYER